MITFLHTINYEDFKIEFTLKAETEEEINVESAVMSYYDKHGSHRLSVSLPLVNYLMDVYCQEIRESFFDKMRGLIELEELDRAGMS